MPSKIFQKGGQQFLSTIKIGSFLAVFFMSIFKNENEVRQGATGNWYTIAILDGLIPVKKIMIGASDCEFHRDAANIIRTPDSLIVNGNLTVSGDTKRLFAKLVVSNWTIRTPAADNGWFSACWSPELSLFCAVANTGVGNRVMCSLYCK